MNGNNMWGWVWGIVLLVIIALGVWWWMSQPASATPTTSATATTTSTTAGDAVVVQNLSSDTVASVIASLSDTTHYESLLTSTGVSSMIAGKGPYTVFVSTDAGFGLLPSGTISGLTLIGQQRVMEYSIVSGKALDISATNNGKIKTLSDDTINFAVQPNALVQANSSFAIQEYKTSNGIVYVINQPLLPPTPTSSATGN